MDPDEAASLLQDTLKEVKRKQDKKKEIKEVLDPRSRSANNSIGRGVRGGTDHAGQSNSVHSSSTDNMPPKLPVSGLGTTVNSSQRQTIASSCANKNMVDDGPAVSLQSSSGFELVRSGTPGQLTIVEMDSSQGKSSCKPVATNDRGYAGQYPSLPSPINQNLKQSGSTLPPTELDIGLPPAQDSAQVKNQIHSNAHIQHIYWTDWSPQGEPTSANQFPVAETSGDSSLYEASSQSSILVTNVVHSHETSHLDENITISMRQAQDISKYNDGVLKNLTYHPLKYSYTEHKVKLDNSESISWEDNYQSAYVNWKDYIPPPSGMVLPNQYWQGTYIGHAFAECLSSRRRIIASRNGESIGTGDVSIPWTVYELLNAGCITKEGGKALDVSEFILNNGVPLDTREKRTYINGYALADLVNLQDIKIFDLPEVLNQVEFARSLQQRALLLQEIEINGPVIALFNATLHWRYANGEIYYDDCVPRL